MDVWAVLPLGLLLLGSGLCSGAETALFSVSSQSLRRMAQEGPAAAMVARLRAAPRPLLVTLLLLNLVVNVLYFAVVTLVVADVGRTQGAGPAGVAGTLAFATLLLGGEILPKLVAIRVPEPAARTVALPVALAVAVTRPLRVPLEGLVHWLTVRLGGAERPHALTADELASLASLAQRTGTLAAREGQMLREVFEASDVRVREIMRPRVDLPAVPATAGWPEVLEAVREAGETRVPLYRESPDVIVGIVQARQALLAPDQPPRAAMARPFFVPESMSLDVLLRECRARGVDVAIVVDEYGATEGMVSVEDAVGEIVGELPDEFGPEEPKPEVLGPGRVLLPGTLPVRDWRGLLGPRGAAAPVATLGGYVAWLANRIPQAGDVFAHGGIRFTVKAMRRHRVGAVLVELEAPLASEAAPA